VRMPSSSRNIATCEGVFVELLLCTVCAEVAYDDSVIFWANCARKPYETMQCTETDQSSIEMSEKLEQMELRPA
jgi:hypothetical protein